MRPYLGIVCAAIGGFVIWQVSTQVTGRIEPWDSPSGYFFWSVAATGFVSALIGPRLFWLMPFAIGFGQMVFINVHLSHRDGIMAPWLVVSLLSVVPGFLGAGAGFGAATLAGRLAKRARPPGG